MEIHTTDHLGVATNLINDILSVIRGHQDWSRRPHTPEAILSLHDTFK